MDQMAAKPAAWLVVAVSSCLGVEIGGSAASNLRTLHVRSIESTAPTSSTHVLLIGRRADGHDDVGDGEEGVEVPQVRDDAALVLADHGCWLV